MYCIVWKENAHDGNKHDEEFHHKHWAIGPMCFGGVPLRFISALFRGLDAALLNGWWLRCVYFQLFRLLENWRTATVSCYLVSQRLVKFKSFYFKHWINTGCISPKLTPFVDGYKAMNIGLTSPESIAMNIYENCLHPVQETGYRFIMTYQSIYEDLHLEIQLTSAEFAELIPPLRSVRALKFTHTHIQSTKKTKRTLQQGYTL